MKFLRLTKRKILDFFAGQAFLFLSWVLKLYYIKELDYLRGRLEKNQVHPALIRNPQILFKSEGVSVFKELQNEGKTEIEKDRVVIYTCVTGGYDEVSPPIFENLGCDLLLFTDDPNYKVPGWQTVHLKNDLNLDPKRLSRLPKILPHRFLRDYDYSIYVDGNTEITGDLTLLIKLLEDNSIAAFKHPDNRNCAYQEADAVINFGIEPEENVNRQMSKYKNERFPEDFGLFECRVLLRKHFDQKVMEAMEIWWNEIKHHSHRDQLSFTYALWKTKLEARQINVDSRKNEFFFVKSHQKKV